MSGIIKRLLEKIKENNIFSEKVEEHVEIPKIATELAGSSSLSPEEITKILNEGQAIQNNQRRVGRNNVHKTINPPTHGGREQKIKAPEEKVQEVNNDGRDI